ncbi:hypothetical protein RIF29_19271 [Crotalaria pallida]|uniref:Tafazzin family protein n=1 Tax=Crotalaria pallida TaxID=3830 RepID=A0AAN9EZP7_CROPI
MVGEGMGTKVQNLPGYYSMRDLNEESSSCGWPLFCGDKTLTNGQYYHNYLSSAIADASSAYDKDILKKKMLEHEATFKNQGMDMAILKLNPGGWVHIFPEGSRSRDGGKTMGSSKRGVGRLVLDGESLPIVVPFVHTGMQEIMPDKNWKATNGATKNSNKVDGDLKKHK